MDALAKAVSELLKDQKVPAPVPLELLMVGAWVELSQMRNGEPEWVPFLVTHVFSDELISGVAFSGEPAAISWQRGSMEFNQVKQGDDNRQWRWPGR